MELGLTPRSRTPRSRRAGPREAVGLLEVLRSDIVPRLLADVPGQPTAAELQNDRYRARFVILFDREG